MAAIRVEGFAADAEAIMAYEVMAGANLLPRLLEAAHACGRAELAALLLMSLPLVSGNLLHRGGSEALMQPLMQACSRAAGDAFERCMEEIYLYKAVGLSPMGTACITGTSHATPAWVVVPRGQLSR